MATKSNLNYERDSLRGSGSQVDAPQVGRRSNQVALRTQFLGTLLTKFEINNGCIKSNTTEFFLNPVKIYKRKVLGKGTYQSLKPTFLAMNVPTVDRDHSFTIAVLKNTWLLNILGKLFQFPTMQMRHFNLFSSDADSSCLIFILSASTWGLSLWSSKPSDGSALTSILLFGLKMEN